MVVIAEQALSMIYFKNCFLLMLVVILEKIIVINATVDRCPNVKNSISSMRRRRHIAFPDGSTVSMTTSVVKTFMTHVPSGWYSVVEADLAYQLPDSKFIAAHTRRKLHHRQKRHFWDTIHTALELRNMNGRACIVRSICEAKTLLAPPGKSLVHDILRVMFTAPLDEHEFNKEIGLTYNELLDTNFCDKANDCPFSLLNFVLDLNKTTK